MIKLFAFLGALFAASGVLLGAFGAHALKEKLTHEYLNIYEIGVRYQMYHALGLFITAWLYGNSPNSWIAAGGYLMAAGIILFSGSLYALSLTSIRAFGAITPIGGFLLIAAWLLIGAGIWGK